MTDESTRPPCACRCAEAKSGERRHALAQIAALAAAAHGLLRSPVAAAADAADRKARAGPPQPGDRLTVFARSRRGPHLRPSDLEEAGKQVLAVPVDPTTGTVRDGTRFNQVLLTRFDPAALDAQTGSRSAGGVVAYSAICTHDACPISSWDAENRRYMCPCHQSSFDPRAGGVITGGPAYRPLPALPLRLEGEELVVAGPFTARIGGGRRG